MTLAALLAGRLPTGHAAAAALVAAAEHRPPPARDAYDALADAAAAIAIDHQAGGLTAVQVAAIGRHLAAAWEILDHAG